MNEKSKKTDEKESAAKNYFEYVISIGTLPLLLYF